MYNDVNRQNETADCASRSHIFIYKHKTHTTPYFLYADTSTVVVGPHHSALDMPIVEATAVELLLLVVKQACVDFLSLLPCSTRNAGRPSSLLHNRLVSPFMLVTHGLMKEKPQYSELGVSETRIIFLLPLHPTWSTGVAGANTPPLLERQPQVQINISDQAPILIHMTEGVVVVVRGEKLKV